MIEALQVCLVERDVAGFGDVRVARRAELLIEQIASGGALVVRRLGEGRKDEMAAHRFLSSKHASVAAVIDTASVRTAEACAGREIVCAQDTSEINFKGRAAARRNLGPAGDGKSPGFFVHPLVAIDLETEAVLGIGGAQIWTRGSEPVGDHHERDPKDRESRRWLDGAERAGEMFATASRVTVVGDRESDIYHLFAHRPAQVELIVRARHDRALADGACLFEALAGTPAIKTVEVKVAPRGPGDRGRTALVELRADRVLIRRPKKLGAAQACAQVAMTLVEAREVDAPAGKTPLLWRLLSSAERPAEEIVRLYRLRWRIEEVFRSLKADGLDLGETQIHDAERLMRLAALGLVAAARTIQLVDARDGGPRPQADVLDANVLPALQVISRDLEGGTARQKNPHPPGSLAFLAWVCARLGGWNCYYKPPGPKTMRTGWTLLAQRLHGFLLAAKVAENA